MQQAKYDVQVQYAARLKDMKLKQTPQFNTLTHIASRASNHNVLRIVRPAFCKRNHVVYMKSPFIGANLFMTPVTLTFLPLVLFLDILCCMATIDIFFTGASSVFSFSIIIWVVYQEILSTCFYLFLVQISIGFTALAYMLLMNAVICLFVLSSLFLFRLIVSFSINAFALKVFSMIRFSVCSTLYGTTRLALVINAISIAFTGMKVFKGSGKPFQATFALLMRGILGYTIEHGRNSPFFHHARGCYQHRSSKTLLPLYYSITPPVEQVQGVL